MSRVRVVRGKYTKMSKENYNLSAEGSIKTFANGQIIENGKEKGVVFGNYQRLGSDVNDDFDIKFSLRKKDYETVVPMGILDYNGKYENALFAFDYTLSKSNVEKIKFEIIDENGEVIFSETTLPEIIISVNKREKIKNKLGNTLEKCLKDSNYSIKTWCWKDIYKEESIPSDDKIKIGSYIIFWDGFDHNEIYDSTRFNNKTLKARLTAEKLGKEKSVEIEFKTEYSEVDWVDVRIDKRNKRIDTTLRVNLRDGGARGLECQTYDIDPDPKIRVEKTECPWDKIPKETLDKYKKEPIKSRTKTYEELREMALQGIDKYWSRHAGNIGKGVKIGEDFYEVCVRAINTEKNAMDDIPLIYNTNNQWSRSGNPGGSYNDMNLDDDVIRLLPDGIIQRISYNVGYIHYGNWKDLDTSHWLYKLKGWEYYTEIIENEDFKETSAHEIGHEILQAIAGTTYSWQHKGSSYYLPQDTKPLEGQETFWDKITHWDEMDTHGENYPVSGEIDLMKYYNGHKPQKASERVIASEQDVLGLIWLTKIKVL